MAPEELGGSAGWWLCGAADHTGDTPFPCGGGAARQAEVAYAATDTGTPTGRLGELGPVQPGLALGMVHRTQWQR